MEHPERERQEIGIYDALLIASWRTRFKDDARRLFDARDRGASRRYTALRAQAEFTSSTEFAGKADLSPAFMGSG